MPKDESGKAIRYDGDGIHFDSQYQQCIGLRRENVQCGNLAEPGTQYCYQHSAPKNAKKLYQLDKWRKRLDELDDNDMAKSVRDELAILRMTLESILQSCDNANDLVIHAQAITNMTDKIANLVVNSHKIEKALGMVIDQSQLITFATKIIQIVSEYIKDPEQLNEIAASIVGAIQEEQV